MHKVLLSLASNYHQKQNLAEARAALEKVLVRISYSPEHWTTPIGTSNPSLYLNQLAVAYTTLTEAELNGRLKSLECLLGRTQELRARGIVPIDMDLLKYGRKRLHERDWGRPYVQKLLPTI